MLLLLTVSLPSLLRLEQPNVGRLVQPRHYGSTARTAELGIPWAADNDCYQGLQIGPWLKMLGALAGQDGCLFAVAPDVVADAAETARQFDIFEPVIHAAGLPVALAAQDGLEDPPWSRFEALFIGGSTEFKLSEGTVRWAAEAKARGKWVHMGRVNSGRRMEHAAAIGCDSVDGSSWVRWRDTWATRGARLATNGQQRLAMAQKGD